MKEKLHPIVLHIKESKTLRKAEAIICTSLKRWTFVELK
mgnify:CR=1 FL=1